MRYIYSQWLKKYFRQILKCYINRVFHFNTTTISRVEGDHRVLKSNLKNSTDDLMTVVDRIEVMLMNQRKTHEADLEKAKIDVGMNMPREAMRDLIGRVTSHALNKILNQYTK